jgi:uncharacterized protein (TIGR02421 family)
MSAERWRQVDRALADAASRFDFLTLVTPVNLDEERERFDRAGRERGPALEFRQTDLDASGLRRQLSRLPFHGIEDRDIHFILAGKHEEVEWQLAMVEARGEEDFLVRSMLHYGPVSAELHAMARRILREVSPGSSDGETAGADEVEDRARQELERYRRQDAAFEADIKAEEDQESLEAAEGDLIIPTDIQLRPRRLKALVHHEVGTHVLTYHNGAKQPLQVLRNGVADYDELQEALGVLAEFLDGGLTGTRLRNLAARVIAVRAVEDGADFMETYGAMNELDLGPVIAFNTAATVHACGGFSRSHIYLRGLMWLLRYLASGGELEPLYVGKIGPHQVPAVMRLRRAGFLRPPVLKPSYVQTESGTRKLERIRSGLSLVDLVDREEGDSGQEETRPRRG